MIGLTKIACILSASLVVLLLNSKQAEAGTRNYAGDTTNGDLFDAPLENGNASPFATYGQPIFHYQSQPFYIDTNGFYDISSETTNPLGWDNYLYLYQGSFDPAKPLNDILIANDDFPFTGTSGFAGIQLVTNTQYYLVTSGFSKYDYGQYTNSISGSGNISLTTIEAVTVSEPSSFIGVSGVAFFLFIKRLKKLKP